jgi:hypothetical protein
VGESLAVEGLEGLEGLEAADVVRVVRVVGEVVVPVRSVVGSSLLLVERGKFGVACDKEVETLGDRKDVFEDCARLELGGFHGDVSAFREVGTVSREDSTEPVVRGTTSTMYGLVASTRSIVMSTTSI